MGQQQQEQEEGRQEQDGVGEDSERIDQSETMETDGGETEVCECEREGFRWRDRER